ncbi:MAG: OmpA family protein [Verrucomicrobiota bacterium]|jgi:peptidoglycan-associated lipoprotein
MKMMKLTCLLAFTLAVVLAATGCRNHRPVGVTPLPRGAGSTIPEASPGPTLAGDQNAGGGPLANIEDINGMAADRTALAGYTVHFAYDSAAVRKSEKANVQAAADALSRDSSTKLLIEGNCDERGTEEYNRSLGERRALAVRKELVKRGLDPTRVFTKSYGKDRPVDSGHDESAWAKNRRDDFVLLHPKSGS